MSGSVIEMLGIHALPKATSVKSHSPVIYDLFIDWSDCQCFGSHFCFCLLCVDLIYAHYMSVLQMCHFR